MRKVTIDDARHVGLPLVYVVGVRVVHRVRPLPGEGRSRPRAKEAKGAEGQGRSRPRGAVRSKQRSSLVVGEYLPREVRHEHGGVEHVAHGVLQ